MQTLDPRRRASSVPLGATRSHDRATKAPEQVWAQLKTNQEQHHHYAEFGNVHNAPSAVADQAEQMRTDNDPGEKIAEDRAETQALGNGHSRYRRQQIDECLEEESFGFHKAIDVLVRRRRFQYLIQMAHLGEVADLELSIAQTLDRPPIECREFNKLSLVLNCQCSAEDKGGQINHSA
jgi:hypothetical protein